MLHREYPRHRAGLFSTGLGRLQLPAPKALATNLASFAQPLHQHAPVGAPRCQSLPRALPSYIAPTLAHRLGTGRPPVAFSGMLQWGPSWTRRAANSPTKARPSLLVARRHPGPRSLGWRPPVGQPSATARGLHIAITVPGFTYRLCPSLQSL